MTTTASNSIIDPIFPECPVRNILARIAEKWALLVLLTLNGKEHGMRFSQLAKASPTSRNACSLPPCARSKPTDW